MKLASGKCKPNVAGAMFTHHSSPSAHGPEDINCVVALSAQCCDVHLDVTLVCGEWLTGSVPTLLGHLVIVDHNNGATIPVQRSTTGGDQQTSVYDTWRERLFDMMY